VVKTEQRDLHGFEQRLLDELRRVIFAGRASMASQHVIGAGGPRRRLAWTRRLALASSVVVVAAAAMVAGIPFVDGEGGPPAGGPAAAYAVTANRDGTVTVEINALRDAEDLERELRRSGVPAVVQYRPPSKGCSEETFALIRPAGSGAGAIEESEDGSLRFEIDKNKLEPGQKLLIYAVDHAPAHPGEPASSIVVSIVDGKVAGC
jgi:hypothetical protein